jgi:hypothetical protein
MPDPVSGRVFNSYRRQETAPYARLLREELSRRLGSQQVFMDVDSIEVGVDFTEAIERAVSSCEVLIALVGPQWLAVTDAEGQPRLNDPDDAVRLEIEAALTRNIRVIPVLVDNTPMPRRQQLPESLVPLTRRNALELTHSRYAYDIGRLLEVVERVVGGAAVPSPLPTVSVGSGSVAELVDRAMVGLHQGRQAEALRDLDRALELEPDNAFALASPWRDSPDAEPPPGGAA